jgi:hypothetical protein
MEIANCSLIIDPFGSNVPKLGITPAEAQFLIAEHGKRAGKCPIIDLQVTGSIERTSAQEKARLKATYDGNPKPNENKVEQLFPGASPTLPTTFKEVIDGEGNTPFAANAKKQLGPNEIEIAGRVMTVHEAEQLIKAGQAALKVAPPAPQSGSIIDQDAEEEDAEENEKD